ncbi:NAD(P)H-binding protein [Kineococcus sp. NUM-3379]
MTTTSNSPTTAGASADPASPGLVAVVGGAGKTGRRVLQSLRAHGVAARTASRSGEVRFDWDDPASWPAALQGAGAAYVAYSPDLTVPGAAERVAALAALAQRSGLTRFVLLSGRGEDGARVAEDAVLAEFPTATVVRAAWFAQNFSEEFLLPGVLSGLVELPVGAVPEPFVDVRDIADVAVAALTDPDPARGIHAGRVHEVTGPESLTFAEAVAVIASTTGRDVRFRTVPAAGYGATLREVGVPAEAVDLLLYLFSEVLDGRGSEPTGDVERVLGRPARRFADYVRETAASGVWNAGGR